MKRFVMLVFMILACARALASVPDLNGHQASRDLLDRSNNIVLHSQGKLHIPFSGAAYILTHSNMLTLVQQGYAEILPEGETPEFVIQEISQGIYQYINNKGQPTCIETVQTDYRSDEQIRCIFYSEGRRFFGNYSSVCFIDVKPAGPEAITYSISVYAHPESDWVRMAAHCMPVKTFFRLKTQELTELVSTICLQIINNTSTQEKYAVKL